ncbi:MAG: MBL fold metallo-hydrolase [Candidatus Woesearchaeota archaeon]
MRITWLGHATFLIETIGKAIYIDPRIDPFSPLKLPKANIILVSHWHPEHCTRESVERLLGDDTMIFGTAEVARQFNGCIAMKAGDKKTADGIIIIRAMPAKTLHHIGGHDEEGFVIGFLIESEMKKIYYTSDTDLLPEMIGLAPDVVIIPVGGTMTMTPEEAAKAVCAMKAKIAIPAHWGYTEGTRDDAELFKEIIEREKEHRAVILKPGEMVTV